MDRFKVFVTDKLSDEALAVFKKHPEFEVTVKTGLTEEQLVKEIPAYDAHIVRSGTKVTKPVIEAASRLKVIGRAGVGVDNVDILAAKSKGIAVMNTPLGNVNSAAEMAAGMMMCLARNIHKGHASMARGEWDRKSFAGRELKGKTLGIIGVGNVGQILAKIAGGFSMKVIGTSRSKPAEVLKGWGVEKVEIDDLLKRSDFISINLTLTPETKYTLDAPQFAKMKKGVYIINAGRGGLINEKALGEAIKSGIVAGAAIDTWESEPPAKENPLLSMPQVLMAPHLGASTREAQENVGIDIANQIIDALGKGKIVNCVNGITELKK
ncbi:MAG: hydroxyacid dehydrogenase [Candidatus Micrarchaeota archaeon]|nr:hydroxyacid dehydrogenase [Candidatus Micrarchaeota archaeon]